MSRSSRHASRLIPRFAVAAGAVLLLAPAARAFDEGIDAPMYHDPDLPFPPVVLVFPEEAKNLWVKALERPEAELRCRAAETIALARRRGVKGLETTVGPLRAALDRPDQHPAVRLAAAHALVALDAQEAAASLFREEQVGGTDLRNLVEPALARWDYRPARGLWLERLRDPATPQPTLVLAIRGLGTVREEQAAGRLLDLVLAPRVPGPVRVEAAQALGELRTDGLEKDAERLAADATPAAIPARLAATALLHRHHGAESVRLLQHLADDPEPAVTAAAVARLLEIDPALLVPARARLLANPDARVRSLAVELLRRRPTEEHVRLLGDRLDDPHPDVRLQARRALAELAGKKELHDPVLATATRVLGAPSWRGLEQAALLLALLDHKPAAGRLVELLTADRPEVFVSAAWALRRLAVPDTLPEVKNYVQAELDRLLTHRELPGRAEVAAETIDHQLSQLNQFLGRQKYAPADGVLRQFVPHRQEPRAESRAAAIWALGLIHEGKTIPALATALEARLNDTHSIPPEDFRVRLLSAVTLGRLRARDALPSLRLWYAARQPADDPINNASGWSIEQITGEAMPPPKPVRKVQRNWFLSPAD
jgi:HEAT repeat protein